jgi:hypothetical protein
LTDPAERTAPVIQRVPSRTRGPILVAIALAVVVGLLVAKPWDSQPQLAAAVMTSPDIEGPPTDAAVAVPTTPPTPTTTGTPIPYPPYTPTPMPTPTAVAVVGGVFTVEFEPDGQITTCTYERHGRRRQLASIQVPAPRAYVLSDRGTGRVRPVIFWFEVITNSEQTVFDDDWSHLTDSGFLLAEAVDGAPAEMPALVLDLDDAALADTELDDTTVVRTRMVLDWHTDLTQADSRSEIVATSYLSVNPSRTQQTTYCPYVIR